MRMIRKIQHDVLLLLLLLLLCLLFLFNDNDTSNVMVRGESIDKESTIRMSTAEGEFRFRLIVDDEVDERFLASIERDFYRGSFLFLLPLALGHLGGVGGSSEGLTSL